MPERFNPIDHPLIYLYPERNSPICDWWGHIPFAAFLVSALRPDLIVELGVYRGDSFSAFCQSVRALDLTSKCIGIDAFIGDENTGPQAEEHIRELFAFVEKRYTFAELRKLFFNEALPAFEDDSIDILHIDGCHRVDAVTEDFHNWLPKLAPTGIMLFHDTAIGGAPNAGVDILWKELKLSYPGCWFEFTHSWGLGVLAPKGVPTALRSLFSSVGTPDEELIQTFFNLQGARIYVSTSYRQNYGDSLLVDSLTNPVLLSNPALFAARVG